LQRGQSEQSVGIHFKFCVVMYDAGGSVRNHVRRVCENRAHLFPYLLSQFLRMPYSLCVKKDRT
jgi:hypothetical protein